MNNIEDDINLDDIEYENLRTALEYREDFYVLPIRKTYLDLFSNGQKSFTKYELIGCPEGIKAATKDKEQIIEWWLENPNSSIGIKAGSESYYVLEVDKDIQLELPETYSVVFENGTRYYFESDKRHNSFMADGINFIGDDGFIVAGDWINNKPDIEKLPNELINQFAFKSSALVKSKQELYSAAAIPTTLVNQDSESLIPNVDNAPEIDFFDEKNNTFDGYKMMQFLGKLGVAKIVDEENTCFIHINNGLVEIITPDQIQDLLMKYLESDEKILSALHENVDKLFTKKKLRQIPERNITTLRDEPDKAFLPFKNGLLVITKDGHELIEYKEDMLIWKHQVIEREWKKDRGGDFEQFIRNTSSYRRGGKYQLDQDDYKAKINTIGYLLHTYKDPAEAKCLILTDASLLLDDHNMNNVDGRTGKSAFCEAVGKIRNVGSCDGMNTRIGFDRFALQNVKRDHQLILFDDARKDFNFQNLFHMITGSLTIEGKNKAKFSIPFKESPKFIITTNYPFEGDGESFKGRQHIVQFSDYYNTKRTIMTEHGKRFFEDWNGTEWAKFDSFMAGCLQQYLKAGKLEQTEHMNYELKKLNMPEFIRWAGSVQLNIEHSRKHLLFLFQNEYSEKISQTKFNKMLRQYAEAMGYKEVN
ncbi:MAG: hypothetical protein HN936_16260, partial [Bacteroidetes bacterium]|nr:hypothetical protein [Bacteroidota bacterium]